MSNEGFYDFHTHTVFSDGGMIPAGLSFIIFFWKVMKIKDPKNPVDPV